MIPVVDVHTKKPHLINPSQVSEVVYAGGRFVVCMANDTVINVAELPIELIEDDPDWDYAGFLKGKVKIDAPEDPQAT